MFNADFINFSTHCQKCLDLNVEICSHVLNVHLWCTYAGPSTWSRLYPQCSGKYQSPIDIDRSLVKFSSSLISFEVPGYETIPRGAHWQLRNNGHSGQYQQTIEYLLKYCIKSLMTAYYI